MLVFFPPNQSTVWFRNCVPNKKQNAKVTSSGMLRTGSQTHHATRLHHASRVTPPACITRHASRITPPIACITHHASRHPPPASRVTHHASRHPSPAEAGKLCRQPSPLYLEATTGLGQCQSPASRATLGFSVSTDVDRARVDIIERLDTVLNCTTAAL